ncbi:ATP-grasp domain-containing protein [Streptomyces sudanensis]|uniref:ATP-grasp domain-containing protein n=1 Tax=Streptomyces sudanensis TaxID=436397 RepID=UPI0020CC7718|nr:ATP-grasp domain-containing protein [Streptomyces sudanensis]MCP9988930.1 ATP-grasp domain-containing protein [Streptomyces sudanensis]
MLVIGWKQLVEEALEALGVPHTTVVEMHKYPKARETRRQEATFLPCGDTSDVEAVLGALARADARLDDVSMVWGTDEFNIVSAAAVAAVLGRPSRFDPATALLFRDKFLQKRAVRQAGIRVARTAVLSCLDDLASGAAAEVGFPAVLKPMAGAGTMLTQRVDTVEELREALAEVLGDSPRSGPFLLEEYVDGSEMHVDGVLFDGEITTYGVSRYFTNNLHVRSGGINGAYMLDPGRFPAVYAEVGALTAHALRTLGLTRGVFHMEVFETPDGYCFSECAARHGGNGVFQSFRYKFGLDLLAEHVKSLVGMAPGTPAASPRAYGRTLLRAPHGRVTAAPAEEELLARPGVLEGAVDLRIGAETPDMTRNSFTRAGSAIVAADDEEALRVRIDDIREWFHTAVTVEPTA